MKKALLISMLFTVYSSLFAQWSDTKNNFADSLAMQVCTSPGDQLHPLVLKSEPDNGYFVIWEDGNSAGNPTGVTLNISAQKYDKDGKRLWAANGIPVAVSSTKKTYSTTGYTSVENSDYRVLSHACSDGDGGFYIAYDESIVMGGYEHYQVRVQHVLANGNRTLSDSGYLVAAANASNNYLRPQLITDGKKGFFIGYFSTGNYTGGYEVYAYCYKDEGGGNLKKYGGGLMNQHVEQGVRPAVCGSQYYLDGAVHQALATGFYLYPDLQDGCNILMSLTTNPQQTFTGYNRLCRVKKDSRSHVYTRSSEGLGKPDYISRIDVDYKKDSVLRLYNFLEYVFTNECRVPNEIVVKQGFVSINGLNHSPYTYGAYNSFHTTAFSRGITVPTDGNINIDVITAMHRTLDSTNQVSGFSVQSYYIRSEKYDSIPWQLCSQSDTTGWDGLYLPYYKPYRFSPPEGLVLDKTNNYYFSSSDTVISTGAGSGFPIKSSIYYDFGHTVLAANQGKGFIWGDDYHLTASGNKVFIALKGQPIGDTMQVYLQQLNVDRKSADSFAVEVATASPYGVAIGKEIMTYFAGTSISYYNPMVATDGTGNAMLYVANGYPFNQTRVSPIDNNGQLLWGSMGAALGTALWRDGNLYRFYTTANPFAVMDIGGKAVIAWEDQGRAIAPGTFTGTNIYMRHIDNLAAMASYQPPIKKVQSFAYASSNTTATPGVLTGSSNAWTMFDAPVSDPYYGTTAYTPLGAVLDNYPLGAVMFLGYEYYVDKPVRQYNNMPYLSRNYSIQVAHNPNGAASIDVRLYFTSAEFDALKLAAPSIKTPADLAVIKQPSTPNIVPDKYTPGSNEETLPVVAWDTVSGGYYVQLAVKSFTNFFIVPRSASALPLTWLDFTVTKGANYNARLNWQVAEEENIKNYKGQYSNNGNNFTDGCTVMPNNNNGGTANYTCTIPVSEGIYYFRVKETDEDGKQTYSKVVRVSFADNNPITVTPNPAKDMLTITGLSEHKNIVLSDITGKLLLQKSVNNNTEILNIGNLQPGIYMLRIIENSGQSVTYKIMKQ